MGALNNEPATRNLERFSPTGASPGGRKELSLRRITTYIAPFMKLSRSLLVLAAAVVVLWYGCDGAGVEPSDEVPVLSDPQTSYDDRDSHFYAAVTVTLPEEVSALDSIWTEMYLATGALADSLGTYTPMFKVALNDSATGGDILPLDGVYARKFSSPLPEGTGGSVRFEFYALIAGDTSNIADTLRLANLQPVILGVSAADILQLPPEGFVTLDTMRTETADPDGLDDIKRVSFTVLKPDSSLGSEGQPISLADNGDLRQWGDKTAGDGIYSIIIMLEATNDTGRYVYRLTAEDFSGAVSDTVRHAVMVVE